MDARKSIEHTTHVGMSRSQFSLLNFQLQILDQNNERQNPIIAAHSAFLNVYGFLAFSLSMHVSRESSYTK